MNAPPPRPPTGDPDDEAFEAFLADADAQLLEHVRSHSDPARALTALLRIGQEPGPPAMLTPPPVPTHAEHAERGARRIKFRLGAKDAVVLTTLPTAALGAVLYALNSPVAAAAVGCLAFLTFPVMHAVVVQYLEDSAPSTAVPPPAETPAATPAVAPGSGVAVPRGAATFWDALTPVERQDLIARGRRHLYGREDVLCREGELAGEVVVILSGWTRVWVREGAEQRIIAFRGAGELVGERAALMVRDRSATVTAESDVQALRVDAHEFAAFLDLNPRVRTVLEQQVYRRQTEKHDFKNVQGNCSILITDITRFSAPTRTDADRQYVLDAMYDLLNEAFTASGLDFGRLYQEDRGDGALVIVPPTTPTDKVVDPMLAHLAADLRQHNRRAADATRLQLRVALHVGPVQRGPKGVTGSSIITTQRMLDAPTVRRRVAETGADLAFVTSDFVFDTVITPAPGLVDPSRYSRVRIRLKEASLPAWLMLEGGGSRLRAV